jgi:hypothetical protein
LRISCTVELERIVLAEKNLDTMKLVEILKR